jgi:hypothetical protein
LAVALLLFKIFPKSDATVEGPLGTTFGELRFKAGGAIAGFVIVFIIMVLLTPNINKTLIANACESPLERWTFSVPIYIVDENGLLYTDIAKLEDQIKIELTESIWKMPIGNRLEFYYPIDPLNITKNLRNLTVEIPSYTTADGKNVIVHELGKIDISNKKHMFVIDKESKRIDIGSSIIIKRQTIANSAYEADSNIVPEIDQFVDKPPPPIISAAQDR